MTAHAIAQYIQYRRKAKTRHGVHSPYVYDLMEKVFLNKLSGQYAATELIDKTPFPRRYKDFIRRLTWYNNSKQYIIAAPEGGEMKLKVHFMEEFDYTKPWKTDILWLHYDMPELWLRTINENAHMLYGNTIIIIQNIHKTRMATEAWLHLLNDPNVMLSIDIYKCGLLFFKNELRERQHFVLKY